MTELSLIHLSPNSPQSAILAPMHNFLHHLNVALYEFNKFAIKFILRVLAIMFGGFIFFATAIIPFFYFENETFTSTWVILWSILSTLGLVWYLIHTEHRHAPKLPTEAIFEAHNGYAVEIVDEEPPQLTWKQSLPQAAVWIGTGYVGLVVLIIIVYFLL